MAVVFPQADSEKQLVFIVVFFSAAKISGKSLQDSNQSFIFVEKLQICVNYASENRIRELFLNQKQNLS